MSKLGSYIKNSSAYKQIAHWLYHIRFKNTEVSLFRFLAVFFRNHEKHELADRASAVAYGFTLAIFPSIIFVFTLIPYLPIPNLYEQILELLGDAAMLTPLTSTIEDVVNRPRGDLLSFSIIMVLFLSTNGMLALMTAFNKIYRSREKRSYLQLRFTAFWLTLLLTFTIFLSISLLTIGQIALNFLVDHGFLAKDLLLYAIIVTRFLVVTVMFLLSLSLIYYFAPSLHEKWTFITPGSLLATFLILLVSYSFSFYISNFGTYNKLYGSIGAMLALMVWLYLLAYIILFGFEFNASLDKVMREAKKRMKKNSTPLL